MTVGSYQLSTSSPLFPSTHNGQRKDIVISGAIGPRETQAVLFHVFLDLPQKKVNNDLPPPLLGNCESKDEISRDKKFKKSILQRASCVSYRAALNLLLPGGSPGPAPPAGTADAFCTPSITAEAAVPELPSAPSLPPSSLQL